MITLHIKDTSNPNSQELRLDLEQQICRLQDYALKHYTQTQNENWLQLHQMSMNILGALLRETFEASIVIDGKRTKLKIKKCPDHSK